MYKLKWVYICNLCGKVALPVVLDSGMDLVKCMPRGWEQKGKNHLCADCVAILEKNPQWRAEYD